MSDGSIIDRQRPDAEQPLRAVHGNIFRHMSVQQLSRLAIAALWVALLPGCLAYHLHDENPLTLEMPANDGMVEIYDGNDPMPTVRGPNAREQLQRDLEAELHDATPEEKAQWVRDVQQLDPAQARLALQMRREMLNRKAAAARAIQEKNATAPAAAFRGKTAQLTMPSALAPGNTQTGQNLFASAGPNSASRPTFGHSTTYSQPTIAGAMEPVGGKRTAISIPVRAPGDADSSVQLVQGVNARSQNQQASQQANQQLRQPPILPLQGPQLRAGAPVTQVPPGAEPNPFENTEANELQGPGAEGNLPGQRTGIRGRFSKWGARFGFGNEGEGGPVQEVAEPLIQNAPDPMPANRQPVANLQTLIIRRENTLRNLGSAAPSDDRLRQDFIRQHVELRLLYMMSGQQSRALGAIPGISPAEQEFWQQVLWGLADYFDLEGKSNRAERISQTVKQFETGIDRLKEEAKLSIHNLNFCRKISSFGSYERFRRDDFTAGQPVLVYCEIDNFKSTPVADGKYKTLLTSRIEIFKGDARGRMIDSVTFKPTEDLCRSARRDYFHSYELTIPQNIGLGPHTLVLTIEDQATGKKASQSVTFVVK